MPMSEEGRARTHRLLEAPRAVYDSEGVRLGFVARCTCGDGWYFAGRPEEAKDAVWKMLASHMVASNPDLSLLRMIR